MSDTIRKFIKIVLLIPIRLFLLLKKPVCNPETEKLLRAKILIISGTGLGNSIMVTPLINEIKSWLPECAVDVLVADSASKVIFEGLSEVNSVFLFSKNKISNIIRLYKNKYYITLLSFPTQLLSFEIIPFIIRTKNAISHDYSNFHPFYNMIKKGFCNIPVNVNINDVEQNLNLLDAFCLNRRKSINFPHIHVSKKGEECAQQFFRENNIHESEKVVAIHPGCKHGADYKRWPIDNFVSLAKKIKERNAKIIFIAGPNESDIATTAKENRFPVLQVNNFYCVLAVLKRCNLLISNDSGVMHSADLLGIPLVVIWGGSDHKRNGAIGKKVINIFNDGIACRPCFHFFRTRECGDKSYKCLTTIKVEDVLEAVNSQLYISDQG